MTHAAIAAKVQHKSSRALPLEFHQRFTHACLALRVELTQLDVTDARPALRRDQPIAHRVLDCERLAKREMARVLAWKVASVTSVGK